MWHTSHNDVLLFADAVHERHDVDRQAFNSYLGEWLSTWRDRMKGGKKTELEKRRKMRKIRTLMRIMCMSEGQIWIMIVWRMQTFEGVGDEDQRQIGRMMPQLKGVSQ